MKKMAEKKSKFGKAGEWNFQKVCKAAADIIYDYLKYDGDARSGRHIASLVRRGRVWELDGAEAWDAFDALASQKDVDPAFIPLARWLSMLSDFHQWALPERK